jgi:hypothetical protein
MNQTTISTFIANIYVGLKENSTLHSIEEVKLIVQNYVNNIGWCVTITPTEYYYTDGNEPGVIIGVINYPRFPKTIEILKTQTLELATILRTLLYQKRVSVIFPQETIMLSG